MEQAEVEVKRPAVHVAPLFDANLFCGNYPFRRLPCSTPEALTEFIRSANLSGAVVTPFESIFYRQPFEGLNPWLEQTFGLPFQPMFWAVVNPLLPGWEKDVASASKHPAIAGLRLFPRYHGYLLDHPAVADVAAAAADAGMPINVTARLLDDRLHPYPLRVDEPLEMNSVGQFLTGQSSTQWVLSMFTMAELKQVLSQLPQVWNVHADIGCSKPFEFWEDDVRGLGPTSQIVYGSGAPLFYHYGGRISVSRFSFTDADKIAILSGNLSRLLHNNLSQSAALT